MADLSVKRLLSLLFTIGLVFGACAPAATPAAAPAPAAPPSAPKAPAPAAPPAPYIEPAARAPIAAPAPPTLAPGAKAPKRGGRLPWPADGEGGHMDPTLARAAQTNNTIAWVYSHLIQALRQPSAEPDDFNLAPDLAESWEVTPDAKTYTFHLRKGAKFQNVPPVNGREVTSDDVKWSIERFAYHPQSPHQLSFAELQSIETPDKYTVIFKLNKPWVPFLFKLSTEVAWVMPKENEAGFKTKPIGSGPMILSKYTKGDRYLYDRDPNFYAASRVYLDGVDYLIIPDASTRLAAFRAGQVFRAELSTPREFENVKNTVKEFNWEKSTTGCGYNLNLQFKNPIFKGFRIRQAINSALDRQRWIDTIYEGQGFFCSTVPPRFVGWVLPQEETRKLEKYDLTLAKKLLAEAGYAQGMKLQLHYNTTVYPPAYYNWIQLMQEDLKKAGIELVLKGEEYATYLATEFDSTYTDTTAGAMGMPDLFDFLVGRHHSQGWRASTGKKIPELDKILEDAASTINTEDRRKKVLDIQRGLLTNPTYGLYEVNGVGNYAYSVWHTWVKDYLPVRSGQYGSPWLALGTWIDH